MEHIYAVETNEELLKYQEFVRDVQPRLDTYIDFLKKEFQVNDLPRSILWTSGRIATSLLSDIPVPAYTNDFRIVITPDLNTWQKLYLSQLDGIEMDTAAKEIREYYCSALSKNHILQILGHELAHHSELFADDPDSGNGIWFEEGMVEYISRQYFLTKQEFEAETCINQQLVNLLYRRYGNSPLEGFGQTTYDSSYAGIFFAYWRSFLAVKKIVEEYNNDVHAVFRSYHAWNASDKSKSLSQWFRISI